MTSFAEQEERDGAAQSRVELWIDCLQVMQRYPIFGAGPDHFPLIANEFGWKQGKEAHSLWMQTGAETGIPGLLLLLGLYLSAMRPMRRLARAPGSDRWTHHAAFMVFVSLAGFIASAQFVTIEGLEAPLYLVVIAAGVLRLNPAEKIAKSPVPFVVPTAVAAVAQRR
jgi:O-antigen ligase